MYFRAYASNVLVIYLNEWIRSMRGNVTHHIMRRRHFYIYWDPPTCRVRVAVRVRVEGMLTIVGAPRRNTIATFFSPSCRRKVNCSFTLLISFLCITVMSFVSQRFSRFTECLTSLFAFMKAFSILYTIFIDF